jgi:hypothetical protein
MPIRHIVVTVALDPQSGMTVDDWDMIEQWLIDHFYARFNLRVLAVNTDVE